jgi:hypothetical protein
MKTWAVIVSAIAFALSISQTIAAHHGSAAFDTGENSGA